MFSTSKFRVLNRRLLGACLLLCVASVSALRADTVFSAPLSPSDNGGPSPTDNSGDIFVSSGDGQAEVMINEHNYDGKFDKIIERLTQLYNQQQQEVNWYTGLLNDNHAETMTVLNAIKVGTDQIAANTSGAAGSGAGSGSGGSSSGSGGSGGFDASGIISAVNTVDTDIKTFKDKFSDFINGTGWGSGLDQAGSAADALSSQLDSGGNDAPNIYNFLVNDQGTYSGSSFSSSGTFSIAGGAPTVGPFNVKVAGQNITVSLPQIAGGSAIKTVLGLMVTFLACMRSYSVARETVESI
ncbi:hypothetical protein SAMN05444156_2452 [Verrucomicrobium sp. GAS474]|uniref:hypothetical protein n=1 Tax=Verrucomicrobium sp. GAS474 TaxID=1882831 RepID=UPI00087C8521|nr:hypothetical protein [Verrucomicrobium sp. GAS474]SDU18152.1 hypothetical protein SAMN05444156_2452 [Verrucomicrobium sp. GAS474]